LGLGAEAALAPRASFSSGAKASDPELSTYAKPPRAAVLSAARPTSGASDDETVDSAC
jgi:hypothetical protein